MSEDSTPERRRLSASLGAYVAPLPGEPAEAYEALSALPNEGRSDLDKAGEILFPDLTQEERNRRLTEAFDRAADPELQERIEQHAAGEQTVKDAIADANAPKLSRIEEYARMDAERTAAIADAIAADPEFQAKLDAIRLDREERDFDGIETDPDEYELEVAADEQDIRIDGIGL